MDGTVVVENNTVVLALFDKIMKIDTKRKHVSIRNKYAIGIVRKDQEILIFDYDRSSRPLAKIKKAGKVMLLRLGFEIAEAITVLQNLIRILKAMLKPKAGQPVARPVHYPKFSSHDYPRDSLGINSEVRVQPKNPEKAKPSDHWKKMGHLKVGDTVIDQKGEPASVIGVHPQGKKGR